MKILLYGGCHAQVLRDYLQLAFSDEIDCSLIINFELIRSGAPFPAETLGRYDHVVFSPIENKGDYNTNHLVDLCRRLGIATICFPWMEWHGYCPGAVKGTFKNRFGWFYPSLVERASAFKGDLDDFHDEIVANFPDHETIDRVMDVSTAHLRAAEQRWDMPFSLADTILAEFKNSRLFLVSDHPSRFCYLQLLQSILEMAGFDRSEILKRFATIPLGEPQEHWRTPIFPRVARRLDLRFEDVTWRDDDVPSGSRPSLRDYLSLYHYRGSVVPQTLARREGE